VGSIDAGNGVLTGLIVVLVVLALAIVFVFPLVLFAAEFVLALALVGVKALLGRWTVVAGTDRGRATWKVRGNGRSRNWLRRPLTAP
jgi:hypothetical protein